MTTRALDGAVGLGKITAEGVASWCAPDRLLLVPGLSLLGSVLSVWQWPAEIYILNGMYVPHGRLADGWAA